MESAMPLPNTCFVKASKTINFKQGDTMLSSPKFNWIPLGVEGGLNEKNLSAHLFAPITTGHASRS